MKTLVFSRNMCYIIYINYKTSTSVAYCMYTQKQNMRITTDIIWLKRFGAHRVIVAHQRLVDESPFPFHV